MTWWIEQHKGVLVAMGNTYPVKDDLLKPAGFRWDKDQRLWLGASVRSAASLWKFAKDPALRASMQAAHENRQVAVDASRAVDADIDIPCPEGMAYMPFQRAGVAYAMEREGVLIADEMGLGKTVQAMGVINKMNARRVLVVCPASLRLVWARHAAEWLTIKLPVVMANGRSDRQFARAIESGMDGMFIINYDTLAAYVGLERGTGRSLWEAKGLLSRVSWDVLVADECHLAKNPKAQRSASLYALQATRRLFLTGTPIVNRPREIWPLIHALDKASWSNWSRFVRRYCGAVETRFGLDTSGATNLPELQARLRETVMVRRLKRDVLTELPAKRRQVIEVEATGEAASVVARQMMSWVTHDAKMKQARADAKAAQEANDEAAYRRAVEALESEVSVAFTEMSAERRQLAVAKVPFVIEHVDAMIESGIGKVIVFAHHHEVLDSLANHFGARAVKIDGRVSKDDRMALADRFQTDDRVEVFIGGIIPAGVGLTLTAAAHVVFAELDWVPGNMTQAEDRAHRIGQANSVLVQHLVFAESLDANMARTLVQKQAVIERGLDKGVAVAPVAVDVPAPEPVAPRATVAREPVQATLHVPTDADYEVAPF